MQSDAHGEPAALRLPVAAIVTAAPSATTRCRIQARAGALAARHACRSPDSEAKGREGERLGGEHAQYASQAVALDAMFTCVARKAATIMA